MTNPCMMRLGSALFVFALAACGTERPEPAAPKPALDPTEAPLVDPVGTPPVPSTDTVESLDPTEAPLIDPIEPGAIDEPSERGR